MTVLPPGALARPAPVASPSGGGGGFRAHLETAGRAEADGPAAGAHAATPGATGPTAVPGSSPGARAGGVRGLEGRLSVGVPPRTGATEAPRLGEAFLRRALDGQRHLDAAVAAARRGRTFSPAELLGLQARLYRATEAVQLFSKTVEQASAAVKQTLRTQV